MAYNKHTWEYGETITASKLNNMEDGIANADAEIGDLETDVSDLKNALNVNRKAFLDLPFTWSEGYITTTGTVHAQTNLYQYYSQLINGYDFESIDLFIGNDIQICVAYYNKDTGVFISRDENWTTENRTIDNTYSVVLMISCVSSQSISVSSDDLSLNLGAKIKNEININSNGDSYELEWNAGYINASGNVDTRQQYNNFYSSLISAFSFKNIIIKPNDNRQYSVAYYNKNTGDFVSRTDTSTEEIEIDNQYSVRINLSTVSRASAMGSITIEQLLKGFQIEFSGVVPFVWHKTKVAFIGDSITNGVNTDSENIYYKIVDKVIGFSDIYADGVAGSCYSSKSNYGTSITPIVNRYQNIPSDRDLVIIFAGTNDWGHNTPIGTIGDTTDVSFYGALYVVINGILQANPSVRLALMTPLHRWGFGDYTEDTGVNGQGLPLKAYVDAIKESAEMFGIPVIDTFSIYGLNPRINEIKTAYIPDGLHPNAKGHNILARRIIPLIEKL